jgi:2-iminobutanoate/2-iminopropanoate deaminase
MINAGILKGEGVRILTRGYKSVEGEGLPAPRGPYSPAVVWENLVFVSGLLAVREDGGAVTGDVREQSMVVLRNLGNVLKAAGSRLENVLSVSVYLADIGDIPAFNEVYEEFFTEPYPSRSAAGVALPGGFKLELAAVAFRDQRDNH